MTDRATQLEQSSIGRMLFVFALPAIIATSATSVYNIIDRIFIGHAVGELGLAGMTIALPVMNLATAFGTLVGAGAAALTSIRLGERENEKATLILGNALLLNIIISIAFTVIMLLFLDPILLMFGANEVTLPYARSFLQIILAGNLFTHILFGLNSIMRASGYPFKAMFSILITVACNLILAPIFIFAFEWGMRGAATATVISQFVGMCWVLAHFSQSKSRIHFQKQFIRIHLRTALAIFAIGLSPFIIHVCASLINVFINRQLDQYGNFAIATYGIIAALQSLVVTMVLGLTHGMQPIVGFNYGARHNDRVMKTYRLTLLWATIICATFFLAIECFPQQIAHAFTDDTQMISAAVSALRISCAAMLVVGFQIVTSTFFQAINKAVVSIFLSLLRQLIFLLPFLWFLPRMLSINGVWWSMPAADFCAAAVTAVVMAFATRKLVRQSYPSKTETPTTSIY